VAGAADMEDDRAKPAASGSGGVVARIRGGVREEKCGDYADGPLWLHSQPAIPGFNDDCVRVCGGVGELGDLCGADGGISGDLSADDTVGGGLSAGAFCGV